MEGMYRADIEEPYHAENGLSHADDEEPYRAGSELNRVGNALSRAAVNLLVMNL